MKKVLLGVLALSSIAAVAETEHFHGKLKSESGFEVKATDKEIVKESEKQAEKPHTRQLKKESLTEKLNSKLDVNFFANENRDIQVFAGLGGKLSFNEKQTASFNLEDKYYFGGRWDSNINDNFNIQLTFAQKNGYFSEKVLFKKNGDEHETKKIVDTDVFSNVIVEQLKAKNKFDEKYYKDNKREFGYKLADPDSTTLLSAVLTGKINNNYKLVVGGLYNSTDFKDGSHALESFSRVKGDINSISKFDAQLTHEIKSGSYDNFGGLNGDVKFDTTLNANAVLKNKVGANLKNITKVDNGHEVDFFTENSITYTNGGLKVTPELNYTAKLNTKQDSSKADSKRSVEHLPEVKLGVEVKPVEGLTVSSKLANKFTVKDEFEKTSDRVKEFKTNFSVDNEIKYALTKTTEAKLLANYKLEQDLKKSTDSFAYPKHELLVGAEVKEDSANFKNLLGFRYALLNKKTKEFEHGFFGYTNNKFIVNVLEGTNLELVGNAHSAVVIDQNDANKITNKDSIVFTGEVGAKVVNKVDKFTNTVDLNGKYYGLYHVSDDFKTVNRADHFAKAGLGLETKYQVSEVAELGVAVNTNYTLNKFGDKIFSDFNKQIEEGKLTATISDKKKETVDRGLSVNDQHDLLDQQAKIDTLESASEKDKLTHELKVSPKLFTNIKLLGGNLEIMPSISADVEFSNIEKDGSKTDYTQKEAEKRKAKPGTVKKEFGINQVVGKANLTIKYSW